ncbi:MAG TPA: hypothetical protein VKT25_00105 [Ktedonobacteraceae bacterium]|nr:hypothetical protein [Ktedonobacteraceae bacterium]
MTLLPLHRPIPFARRGMVVAPHYLAAEAGLELLKAGGNAIDLGHTTMPVVGIHTVTVPAASAAGMRSSSVLVAWGWRGRSRRRSSMPKRALLLGLIYTLRWLAQA